MQSYSKSLILASIFISLRILNLTISSLIISMVSPPQRTTVITSIVQQLRLLQSSTAMESELVHLVGQRIRLPTVRSVATMNTNYGKLSIKTPNVERWTSTVPVSSDVPQGSVLLLTSPSFLSTTFFLHQITSFSHTLMTQLYYLLQIYSIFSCSTCISSCLNYYGFVF